MLIHRSTISKILFTCAFFLLLIMGCDKERNRVIPYVPVSFSINLNVYNDLSVPGNSAYIPGHGFAGVIIYCEMPGSYYAFDAACTVEISQTCRVANEGVIGTCPCCKSQYILMGGGYPSVGPAARPLQQYNVAVISNMLRVFN